MVCIYHSTNNSSCDRVFEKNKKIFKNKRDGFFLDIGANDGITLSNSYFFEKELGWKGICFEPLKNAFQKLQNDLKISFESNYWLEI